MLLRTMTNLFDPSDEHASPEERISVLADTNDVDGLCRFVAARAGLDEQTTKRFLLGTDEGPPALMARTAGLSANAYSALLRFRHRLLRTDITPGTLLSTYSQLPKLTSAELRALLLIGLKDAA